jgi:ABC-type Fe3+-hydroxamate transport system substrate-binding protein
MGAGPRVVGVTEYCVHPREAVDSIAKVGGSKLPDLEVLFALNPDLVIMNEEENRIEDYEEIERRGIPILNTFPKKVIDTAAMLRDIGRATGCEAQAERLARDLERVVAEPADPAPALRAICLIWKNPFMSVNADTFMHDMMQLGGFENLLARSADRYPRLTKDELQSLRATRCLECILLPNEPFEFVAQQATEIAAMAGLPTARAVLCDGQYLAWYGSRTARGVAYTRQLAAKIRALPPL